MIVLQDTNDTLEVVLNAAHTTNALPVVSNWRDITTSGYTPGRSNINTNGTTPITAVAAPGASTQRVIDFVSIYNRDTVNQQVTVRIDDNSTEYVLTVVTLGPGERVEYQEGIGWTAYNSAGAQKTIITGTNNLISSGLSMTVLGTDVTNNNATLNTMQDITGLSFPVTNGNTYYFRFVIHYTSAATTTGARWSIAGSAGATFSALRFYSQYSLTTTTITNNQGLSAVDTPAASNATPAAVGSNIAIVEGFAVCSASGSMIGRFASEVANSAIIARAGSIVEYAQVL